MRGFRCIVSVALALALVVSAGLHGARAAAMAVPMGMDRSAEAEPCHLCGGAGAEAAMQCALVCAGLTGVLCASGTLAVHLADSPTAGVPAASAGRLAGPEPEPPR
ncbi:MAG TPA: hypothetical protein VHG92_12245 [Afifellaceae bacterium]|nr:hypothetical protein [Afifellaceae bacterium]